MTCATCGAPLEAGAHFCSTCGHPVEASLPASPGPVADAPETMPLHAPLHHVMRPPVHEVYIPGPPAARPATPAAALWPLIGLVILGLVVFCSVGAIVTLLSARSRPAPFQPAPPRPFLTATPTSADPPRMSLEDVKILYDDPGSGLVILDVRAADTYAAGHIKGAISFPEADVDQRVSELPRDKLIVAYCQWPAENESARVAQKLHDQYEFSYTHLKVLKGGWHAWNDAGYPTESDLTPTRVP